MCQDPGQYEALAFVQMSGYIKGDYLYLIDVVADDFT
jgi:hypothetical protein